MSKKEYISILFNAISWRMERLGEAVHLLIAPNNTPIEIIHQSTFLIKKILEDDLNDIVPAYHSIAIFTKLSVDELKIMLQESTISEQKIKLDKTPVQIPICYEMGLDLDVVADHSGLSVNQTIELHLKGNYRSLFIGFTPGFIYADGLDEKLACPRKASPRKSLAAGSVGIGGNQSGIYSLASPGGWNIVGRTPLTLFDSSREQPMIIDVGTSFQFYRISKEEFESWGN